MNNLHCAIFLPLNGRDLYTGNALAQLHLQLPQKTLRLTLRYLQALVRQEIQHHLPGQWIKLESVSQQHGLDRGATRAQRLGNILQALSHGRGDLHASLSLDLGKVFQTLAGVGTDAPIPTVQIQIIPPGQQCSSHPQFIGGKTGMIEAQWVIAVRQAIAVRGCTLCRTRLTCH